MQKQQILIIDTMIIFESIRTNCWNALAGFYRLETVEECHKEALAGDQYNPNHVIVNPTDIGSSKLIINSVSNRDKINFSLKVENPDAIDAGERDLFSHLLQRTDQWITCCTDRAALKIALRLGWGERIYALSELINCTGVKPNPKLADQFGNKYLSRIRTEMLMQINR